MSFETLRRPGKTAVQQKLINVQIANCLLEIPKTLRRTDVRGQIIDALQTLLTKMNENGEMIEALKTALETEANNAT